MRVPSGLRNRAGSETGRAYDLKVGPGHAIEDRVLGLAGPRRGDRIGPGVPVEGPVPAVLGLDHHRSGAVENDRTVALDDKVCRALGILRSARLLASEETLFLLSHLRMGVNLGRVKDIDLRNLNELFLLTQPAHLQKIQGKKLEGDLRRAARADYIRQRLNTN